MDIAPLQLVADSWFEDFIRRFPGRITATGEIQIRLLQLLNLVDAVRPQRFTRDAEGLPVFRLHELAQALGLGHRASLEEALASSLVSPHLHWVVFAPGRPAEAAVTVGGMVTLVAVISPSRFRSPERRAWHSRRRAAALAILRLLHDPDVGAQINALVQPLPRLLH